MSNVFVSVRPRLAPGGQRRQGPKVLGGLRRKKAHALKNLLSVVQREDAKEEARGIQLGYSPYLVRKEKGSNVDKAFQTIIKRLQDALVERAS